MLHDDVYDAGLDLIKDNVTIIHICSAEPSDYSGVSTVSLGSKTGLSFTGPVDGDSSGRKITVAAVVNGVVTTTGTATHWALVSADKLYASGSLYASQAVTKDDDWTLPAFDIGIV